MCTPEHGEEDFHGLVERLFGGDRPVRSVTLQITDGCNLRCSYCYQGNKGEHMMTFETAKRFMDMLLDGNAPYINLDNSVGFTMEFIGGEPFLAVDLMDQITGYVLERMIREKHPWLDFFRVSITSNGTLYFDERVQAFMKKYGRYVSLGISVDGCRELHDACRVFQDGSGSYDVALAAAKHHAAEHRVILSTKMTLAPANVQWTAGALKSLVENGYANINANCAFEEGWNVEHAAILYEQLKEFVDWLFDESGRWDSVYCSIFKDDSFGPLDPEADNENWCGGNGQMIAVDWKGDIYPCLRYMESSLGSDVEPIIIGTVDGGIEATPEQKEWVRCLQCMTRCSQSTDECVYCPIARGCAWCSAYNYQYYGCLNKRATHICVMHQARALANVYFWNRYYRAKNRDDRMECRIPRDWALKIVSEEEYDFLLKLSRNKEE